MTEMRTTSQEEKAQRQITIPTASMILQDGSIAEMVYDPDTAITRFAIFRDDGWTYERSIPVQSQRTLVPFSPNNNLLKSGVILFPSEVKEYGSESELVGEIRSFIHRYVDVSPLFEEIASYYVLFSWVYDDFHELPYLRVLGDAGSGKTRFLLTVGSLCYKPIFASGSSTVSPLFRLLDLFRGTLVIDEGDFRFSDEQADIVKILNNGSARGFPVLRTEQIGRKEYSPQAYQVFGPKIIATRGPFQDKALESRCLTEDMGHRRLREDIPINFSGEPEEEARQLRNKLLAFRFRNLGKRQADPRLVDRSIEPRLNQIFVPLISIIDDQNARERLRQLARAYHRQTVSDRGMEIEAQLLEVVREIGRLEAEPSVMEIAQRFHQLYESEYDRRITAKWIGSLLRRRLGIRPERRREGFVIPQRELEKLTVLYEKYGLLENQEEGIVP